MQTQTEENKNEIKKEEVVKVESNLINYDHFSKIDLKVGKILEVSVVENADKLLKLKVDFGNGITRQIVSGIKVYFKDLNSLVGVKCMFVYNLESRTIRGLESQGMILALSDENNNFSLLSPNEFIREGISAK